MALVDWAIGYPTQQRHPDPHHCPRHRGKKAGLHIFQSTFDTRISKGPITLIQKTKCSNGMPPRGLGERMHDNVV